MRLFTRFALLLSVCVAVPRARGELIVFDFDNGPGSSFTTVNSGGLFTLDLDGPTFRVSKASDSGTFDPTGFVSGGIRSVFSVVGDFTATVDFTLHNVPINPAGTVALNESLLTVLSMPDPTHVGDFSVLRFTVNGGSFVEVFGTPGGPAGAVPSSQIEGRYRIERMGTTLTGLIAPAGSDVFTTVGSFSGFTSPAFQVQLSGTQGTDVVGGNRSTTALDVSFDNLIIEAQGITGMVPEPASLVSAALGLVGLAGYAGWRRVRSRRLSGDRS